MSVSDDFNRADGGLGSNWTNQVATQAIVSNTAKGGTSNQYNSSFWNANSFANDHTSQITFANGVNYVAPGVRMSSTGGSTNWYAYFNHGSLQKTVAGSFASISDGLTNYTNGDTAKLEANGTSLKLYKNGSLVHTLSDSALASGSPGIAFYSNTGSLDDWIATGEVVASRVMPPPRVTGQAVNRAATY